MILSVYYESYIPGPNVQQVREGCGAVWEAEEFSFQADGMMQGVFVPALL